MSAVDAEGGNISTTLPFQLEIQSASGNTWNGDVSGQVEVNFLFLPRVQS